jgi:hypothetical protein
VRAINAVLGLLVGIALAAGGALVIIEAAWTWTGSGFVWIPGGEWLQSFKTTAWSDNEVVAISVAVAAVGLILLLVEIRPHKKRTARFATDKGDWALMRRSTEAHLERRLQSTVPTSPIKTRITPKVRRWRVEVKAKAAASTEPILQDATQSELTRLRAPGAQVKVKASGTGKP